MKIFRWLFSNLFLILLIVVVIYSYMFWGNLVGNDTPAGKVIAYLSQEFVEVEEFIHAIEEKQSQLAEKRAESSSATAGLDVNKANELAAAEEAAAFNNNNRQQPLSFSNNRNQTQARQNYAGAVEAKTVEVTSMPAAANALQPRTVSGPSVSEAGVTGTKDEVVADTYISAELENKLNKGVQGKIFEAKPAGDDVRAVWIKARKSFYQRNYALSEQSYQEVIDNTQDEFDAYGELGNVYFNQGKNQQAASAYFEAAAIMVRKGQAKRAKSLLGLLQHLDQSKAEELQKLIDSASS
jgi:tetratricopeptide (TPR) repeat protein